jgi:hypothetical protein
MLIAGALAIPAVAFSELSQSKSASFSCKVFPENRAPANDAEKALWAHDWVAAATEYQKLLAAHPNDPTIIAGLTRSYLAEWKNDEAAAVVAQAHGADSNNPILMTAVGEVTLRQGNVPGAWKLFVSALRNDVCYARAHYEMFAVMKLSSMNASAYKQLKVAYQLDPSDPDTLWAWQSVPERIVTLQRQIDSETKSKEASDRDASVLARLQQQLLMDEHHCHAISPVTTEPISMTPHLNDLGQTGAWALDTRINNQEPVRLTISTGSSGITLNRIAAEHAGLKSVLTGHIWGVGDKGAVGASLAYADSVRIGGIEFADCPITVSEERSIVGASGTIGTDIFRDFLISLDYPLRKFSLRPLPTFGKGSDPAVVNASSSAVFHSHELTDPYSGPEVSDFVPMYIAAHGELLINTKLNQVTNQLMALSTSSGGYALFNSRLAPRFVKATNDNSLGGSVRGISGRATKVSTVGFVTMQYGRNLQMHLGGDDAVDLSFLDRATGMEIAGTLGGLALYQLAIDIDYRDGLVRFGYDRRRGSNAW